MKLISFASTRLACKPELQFGQCWNDKPSLNSSRELVVKDCIEFSYLLHQDGLKDLFLSFL